MSEEEGIRQVRSCRRTIGGAAAPSFSTRLSPKYQQVELNAKRSVQLSPVGNEIAGTLRRMQPRCRRYRGGLPSHAALAVLQTWSLFMLPLSPWIRMSGPLPDCRASRDLLREKV